MQFIVPPQYFCSRHSLTLGAPVLSKRIEAGVLAETSRSNAPAIHAVRLKGRSQSAKAQLLFNHLKQAFGSPPYWDAAPPVGAAVATRQ